MNLAEITKMTEDEARAYLEKLLWQNGPVCPHCQYNGADRVIGKSARPGLMRCWRCRQQFTVTVGTIFEDSHIPLRKWIMAFQMMCASKKGVSALQLQRQLGLGSYRTAWHMAHRIREAMKSGPLAEMLKGVVEVDETYVGGKPRFKGQSKRGRGTKKTPVMALVERGGKVRTRVIANVSGKTLKGAIRESVQKDATIMTDEFAAYNGIGEEFEGGHQTVNHSEGEYVKNGAGVNTAESYFSLFKRGIMGAFHHISKEHLHRYSTEFEFRWNHRKVNDNDRMIAALKATKGKRLSYKPCAQN